MPPFLSNPMPPGRGLRLWPGTLTYLKQLKQHLAGLNPCDTAEGRVAIEQTFGHFRVLSEQEHLAEATDVDRVSGFFGFEPTGVINPFDGTAAMIESGVQGWRARLSKRGADMPVLCIDFLNAIAHSLFLKVLRENEIFGISAVGLCAIAFASALGDILKRSGVLTPPPSDQHGGGKGARGFFILSQQFLEHGLFVLTLNDRLDPSSVPEFCEISSRVGAFVDRVHPHRPPSSSSSASVTGSEEVDLDCYVEETRPTKRPRIN